MRVDTKPLLVRMPPRLHAVVTKLAEMEDKSMAQLVRQAIREYIAKAERRAGYSKET